jgi:hypothetical protein
LSAWRQHSHRPRLVRCNRLRPANDRERGDLGRSTDRRHFDNVIGFVGDHSASSNCSAKRSVSQDGDFLTNSAALPVRSSRLDRVRYHQAAGSVWQSSPIENGVLCSGHSRNLVFWVADEGLRRNRRIICFARSNTPWIARGLANGTSSVLRRCTKPLGERPPCDSSSTSSCIESDVRSTACTRNSWTIP